ncbi:MAG TPA: pyruvate dehydrogenase (acetyl-transferring) E1 component subunit alpha [Jiangellaceae bacterium]|nr:pyruvate dehydrogenase (acetyl-transferring) E1 component subunit alpha [Jiangellaceae bacterium]
MTTQTRRGANAEVPAAGSAEAAARLLPAATPIRFLDDDGALATDAEHGPYQVPSTDLLSEAYRRMVIGRRFDAQATALTKQGRLAVYPSSHGQEACQIGGVLALRDTDWLFPTYRDSMALITRDIDPVEALTLLRGDWHCGYDPKATRTAPQCTPLATQTLHAVGLAYAAQRRGEDTVAMVFVGDGGTSEGDFHEALNFAAVYRAPVVFLIQNNGFAISVPLSKQTAAPALAYKGVGYGVRSEQVDGNDPVAVLAVLQHAVEHARTGDGPFLVEAHTYRIEAHTNADDATRYRDADEVAKWERRDPIARLEAYLMSTGALTDEDIGGARKEAEVFAGQLRDGLNADPRLEPLEMFDHVFTEPTPQLREQRGWLAEELEGEA